eukprot:scaffold219417_cov45-Attheya_sp.AAC.2
MDVPRVLVGLEMIDCRAIEEPYILSVGSAIVDYFSFRSTMSSTLLHYLRPRKRLLLALLKIGARRKIDASPI